MRLINFFRNKYRSLTNVRTTTIVQTKNELIHPRFEIEKDNAVTQKSVSNSLLFLMYSKENETLFV
jgi:hypothetical protein